MNVLSRDYLRAPSLSRLYRLISSGVRRASTVVQDVDDKLTAESFPVVLDGIVSGH